MENNNTDNTGLILGFVTAVAIFLALIGTGCGATIHGTGLVSKNGNPVRMRGDLVTVRPTSADREEVYAAVELVNDLAGIDILTTRVGGTSRIWVQEKQLPYCVQGVDEGCEVSNLERARFIAPEHGTIDRCEVTVNTLIPDQRSRVQSMAHGLLHCLGLKDDVRQWGSIMDGSNIGIRVRLSTEDIDYLEAIYGVK